MNKTILFYTRLFILFATFFSPLIYLFIKLRKSNVNNVLVIPQFKRIGDIVCSTPVFRAIKEKYPDSHITVITSVMASGILKDNPRIDEIIVIEDYQNNFISLLKKIREGRYSWGISLSGSALSSVLMFGGLIPNRLKIVRPNKPLSEFLSDWMCNKKEYYNQLSYLPLFYLKMLCHAGVENNNTKKEVFTNEASEREIERFFESKGIKNEDLIVAVSLTAGNKIKEWGDDKFEVLVKKINEKYKAKIVFIGSLYDKVRVISMVGKLNGEYFINAAGCSLGELVSLMKRVSVFISVDTGPTHIAHALGIPLIDILGPVNDIELTPHGEKIKIIKPEPEVAPTIFAFRNPGSAELTKKALENISVDQVIAAFEDIYKKVNPLT